MGATWSDTVRRLLFSLIPLVVISIVIVIYFRNNEWTKLQRWAIMGIVGGGLGNLIDRFFRAEGVVDFLDVKWFGLTKSPVPFLRMERWPTFNIADSSVVVCGILLIVSFIILTITDEMKDKESKKQNSKESEAK